MRIFTNDPALIGIAAGYLRVAAWSYLLTGLSQSYLALLKISEHAGDTAAISSAAVVLNIGLNAVLIFGLFSAPRMGVRGATVATLAARIVEAVWAVSLSFRKGYIRPQLRFILQRNSLLSKVYYRCMLPLLGAEMLCHAMGCGWDGFISHPTGFLTDIL